jgi:hypothetical protein
MTTQREIDNELFSKAMFGNLPEIKRLLTSPTLEIKANIHAFDEACLILACEKGNIEIIQYLLTSPELTEHAHLHAENYQPFKALCINTQLSAIQYLIFELDIPLAKEIEYYLNTNISDTSVRQEVKDACIEAKLMFEKRETAKKLHKELNSNGSLKKKLKL